MFKHLLYYLFIFCHIIIITKAELKFCSESVKRIQLCKMKDNYRVNGPPKSFSTNPTILTPILNLQNILDVDHDKKYMTIYFTIETHWNNPDIGVSTPEGIS